MNKVPSPPEKRLQCSFCGHTKQTSEYKHFCWAGFIMATSLMSIPLMLLFIFTVKLLIEFVPK